MSVIAPDCRHARLHIGAAPQDLPPDVTAHITTCADCSRFRDETLALDGRVRSALEVPLPRFREAAPPGRPVVRRYALAASLVLALLVAGGFWFLSPQPALAGEVAEHVVHEAGSWDMREPLTGDAVGAVLRQTGVEFDSTWPVVYAMACPFRGRLVPHLVVQTPTAPVTLMLLAHEKVAERVEFSGDGFRGVLLPWGNAAIAVLSRDAAVLEEVSGLIAGGVRG